MLAQPPHPTHPKYRPDIDGLRAVAVLAVVGFHAFPTWIRGGFIGVDVFFVISGYLISTIIMDNLSTNTFSFSDFYTRRIKRIFPALLLVLTASYCFGWFALLADEYKQLGKHIAGGTAFISNLLLWNEAGYFDNTADTKPLLHLWSLGVEEQFYIIWPLLLWLSYKNNINILGICILVGLVSFYLNIQQVATSTVADFYSPQTRFWELMSGNILAWISIHRRKIPYLANNLSRSQSKGFTLSDGFDGYSTSHVHLVSVSGFLLLTYGVLIVNKDIGFPGKWAVIPVLGTTLIIYAGPQAWPNRIVLSNKVMVWFGLISFPLYLWHWPLLSFAHILVSDTPTRNVRIAAVIVAIILSWLTYTYVERPVRFGQNNRKTIALLSTAMFVVCICGLVAFISNGFPSRSSLRGLDSTFVNNLAEDDKRSHKECLDKYGLTNYDIRFCRITKLTPHIAIVGDSHGAALFKALSEDLERDGKGLLMIGGRLFTTIASYPDGKPEEIQVYKGGIEATEFVAHENSLDTIIIVSRGPAYIYDNWNFFLLDHPEIKDKMLVYETGLRDVLTLMTSANKKQIVLVLDNPELDFNPMSCSNVRPLRSSAYLLRRCETPRVQFDMRQDRYRKMVFSVLKDFPQVAVFDPAKYLCDRSFCFAKLNGAVLYSDADHLSYAGARLLSSELIKILNDSESPKSRLTARYLRR
jgi:peptidoglycan/LPS O-acetylase OafA/YrhL